MSTISPNMTLVIPSVGITDGPEYAEYINACLEIIDGHDHSTGSGVQITPAGINISSELSFNGYPATQLQYIQLENQSSIDTLQALYVKPGGEGTPINDLWYNDGNGTAIQLTKDGVVNALLASLPGQSYGGGTFTWKQGTGSTVPANFDIGDITIRPTTAATTYGITLTTPPAIASAYTLVLPALPAAQKFMTLDASGNIAAPWSVDDVTIKVVSNQLVVQSGAIPNISREHNWECNGIYSGLTFPSLNIDAVFIAPYDMTINSIWVYHGDTGTSGTTELDLKRKSPGGAWASIFSTTPKFTVASSAITLTSVGTTATATLAGHGFSTGQSVVISGATQANYNGTFTITVTSSSTFTYTMVGAAVSPGTGSPVVTTPADEIYTDSGSVVAAQVGVTKPVLSTSTILAGQAIKFDLISSMAGSPADVRIRMFWTQS